MEGEALPLTRPTLPVKPNRPAKSRVGPPTRKSAASKAVTSPKHSSPFVAAATAGTPLDSIDLALIEELQDNARTSFAELARRVHLSTPAVIDRVHRLEETGVILRYRADINPVALGLHVRAFVKVNVAGDRLSNFARIARQVPEILECHRVTGNESFLVQVAVRDMNHLETVIDSLMPYLATNTSMILNSPVQHARFTPSSTPPGGKAGIRKQR